jgi:hypothetical protein
MADVAAPPEFSARTLLRLVRAAPGGGIHRTELEQQLARPWTQIWPVASQLYARRLIDFCGRYMVAVPGGSHRPRALQSSLPTREGPAPGRRGTGAIMCGPRPPTDADRAAVEDFGRELERRAQLQLVPSVRKLADELAALDRARP